MDSLPTPSMIVDWEQIQAAVPDEAAAFEAAIVEAGVTMEDFCRYDHAARECLSEAWNRLSKSFKSATGLELAPYYEWDDSWGEFVEEGFQVFGAWQLTTAGKKFLGIREEA